VRYDEVAALEAEIRKLLDEIPYSILAGRKTAIELDNVETYLSDAVAALREVRIREAPRYREEVQS
jgi:hypothetical protein